MFKNKKQTLGVILWIAVIAEIVVIFVFSGMDKGMSDKMSSPMSDTANDFIARHIVTDLDERPKKEQDAFELKICIFVRKTAHLFEYALLGALFLLRFRLYGTSVFRASMYFFVRMRSRRRFRRISSDVRRRSVRLSGRCSCRFRGYRGRHTYMRFDRMLYRSAKKEKSEEGTSRGRLTARPISL